MEVIVNGKVADIDLGKINDDYFANSAAIGLAPTVARSIPLWMKRYLGIAGYGLVAATKFFDHRPFRCELHEEGGNLTVDDALEVIIANGKYHGGVLVAEDADPESFELVVRIVKGPSKLNLLLAWLLPGSSGPDVVLKVRVQKGSLTTDPWQYVSLDGEVVMRTPLKLAVAVEALLMMVPPRFEDRDLPNDFEPAA